MAHKINHLFQYQEEKQQHSENWDETTGFPKKQPLSTAQGSQQHPQSSMDPAELSYYEHKSKLRKTQVNRRAPGDEGQAEVGEVVQEEKSHGHTPPSKYSRPQRDAPGEPERLDQAPIGLVARRVKTSQLRECKTYFGCPCLTIWFVADERRSKEREEPRPPLAPMIEDYNHGKEFPTLKSLPGLRFRRRADPRDSGMYESLLWQQQSQTHTKTL